MTAGDNLYLLEATRGTYPSLTAMNYFGIEPKDNRFVLEIPDVMEINTSLPMGTRTPVFTAGNSMIDAVTANYGVVNGTCFYRMLGDSTSADGVHTCATHATTAKPSISVFRQGYAATEKKKAAGGVSKNLQLRFNAKEGLWATETFGVITDAVSTDTPVSNVFPSNIATLFDTLLTFTVNGASYTGEDLSWSIAHEIYPYGNNAGKYRGITDTNPIVATLVANLVGDVTALRALKGTSHNVVCKFGKSVDTAKYLQINATGMIYDLGDKNFHNDPSDRAVVSWVLAITSAPVKDGVADTHYGD